LQIHRGVVVAQNGIVAASQPLAVSAGLGILQRGGSFIDAALATSAALAVVEPAASHLGGDAFVIVYDASNRRTTAFNASGAAPRAASLAAFAGGIPIRGLQSASVPGLVDCWFRLHELYGTLPMPELLAPAIGYAGKGFPAGYRYSRTFQEMAQTESPDWFVPMAAHLLGSADLPKPGVLVRQHDLAKTLQQIAVGGRDAFYDGPLTERFVQASQQLGGLFEREDFANHRTQISDPLRTDYRGYSVHAQPPVSQGHILSQMLNLLDGWDGGAQREWDDPDLIHFMVEAKKLAFADRAAYLGDPAFVQVPLETLLSRDYATRRRQQIDPSRAAEGVTEGEVPHDTTYFCVADRAGNAVSFIQSVFHRFGCGVVAPGTGVLFNNRMTGFSLTPGHPNVLASGKRTAHTLNAYVVTKGDRLAWVGGTPGADVQVQSNFQVIRDIVDNGVNPQEAIEIPRWQHSQPVEGPVSGLLEMESRFPAETLRALEARGHHVQPIGDWGHGSSYQLLAVDPETGAYQVGSDPRCDGHAAGF
jgi:gamma-glutamyltranspeptidase/glutathione hydrolase